MSEASEPATVVVDAEETEAVAPQVHSDDGDAPAAPSVDDLAGGGSDAEEVTDAPCVDTLTGEGDTEYAAPSVEDLASGGGGDDDEEDDDDIPRPKKRLKKRAASDDDDEAGDDAAGEDGEDGKEKKTKKLKKMKKKKKKKEKKDKKKGGQDEMMEDLFGSESDDDEASGDDESDIDVDPSLIVHEKRQSVFRGDEPAPKKSMSEKARLRRAEAEPDDEGTFNATAEDADGGGFICDDDQDENMASVMAEYGDEVESPGGSEAEEDNDDRRAQENERRAEDNFHKNEIDNILGITKKKRAKRSEDERRRQALNFIDKMSDAADQDEVAMQEERPATHKLALMPDIVLAMKKKEMVGLLMDNDVLSVLRRYVSPIDNQGTLPTLNLRTGVLDLLLNSVVMSITEVWQLQKSHIGEDIIRLKEHPDETRDNRKKAAKLVETWFRMLTGTSENLKDLSHIEEEKANTMALPKRKKAKDSTSGADLNERRRGQAGSWHSVSIPFPEEMTYMKRPKTSTDVQIKALESKKNKKQEEKTRVDLMKDKVRKNAGSSKKSLKGGQAVEVSIEGRGMEKYI